MEELYPFNPGGPVCSRHEKGELHVTENRERSRPEVKGGEGQNRLDMEKNADDEGR